MLEINDKSASTRFNEISRPTKASFGIVRSSGFSGKRPGTLLGATAFGMTVTGVPGTHRQTRSRVYLARNDDCLTYSKRVTPESLQGADGEIGRRVLKIVEGAARPSQPRGTVPTSSPTTLVTSGRFERRAATAASTYNPFDSRISASAASSRRARTVSAIRTGIRCLREM